MNPLLTLKRVFPSFLMPGLSVVMGALYGVFMRYLFVHGTGGTTFDVFSLSFFCVPFGLGFLQIYVRKIGLLGNGAACAFLPWASIGLCFGTALVFKLEGVICIVMFAPLALMMASIGGMCAGICRDRANLKTGRAAVFCCAILPLMMSPLEQRTTPERQIRTVENEIHIAASPRVIWDNIKSVRLIRRDEMADGWTQRIGFPRPLAATLSEERVGGVRRATFERGVLFYETVTKWEPDHVLAFTIKADTASIPPTTLDEHVTVGGPYFDVLDGEYRIEALAGGGAILHLTSHHRLSTRLNGYAGLWTNAIMSDIQSSILRVIQRRCISGV